MADYKLRYAKVPIVGVTLDLTTYEFRILETVVRRDMRSIRGGVFGPACEYEAFESTIDEISKSLTEGGQNA